MIRSTFTLVKFRNIRITTWKKFTLQNYYVNNVFKIAKIRINIYPCS